MGALYKIISKYAESISPHSENTRKVLSLSRPKQKILYNLKRQDRMNKKTISIYCPFHNIEFLLTLSENLKGLSYFVVYYIRIEQNQNTCIARHRTEKDKTPSLYKRCKEIFTTSKPDCDCASIPSCLLIFNL
jgi:hypothetical protein